MIKAILNNDINTYYYFTNIINNNIYYTIMNEKITCSFPNNYNRIEGKFYFKLDKNSQIKEEYQNSPDNNCNLLTENSKHASEVKYLIN